jgi:aldehyde dehydrogenase (NAD+)
MHSHTHFYAEGRLLPSGGAELAPVINPATGEPLASVRACSVQDLDRAVRSARAGAAAWADSSLAEREAVLRRMHQALKERADEAARSLAQEMGCPVWLGGLMQLPMPLKDLEFTWEGMAQIAWSERVGNGLVERVGGSVVAAITPWNFPLHQIVAKIAPAIAAGCAVVLKPSELTPGAAQLLFEILHGAGLPAGVVNMVWGGPDIGEALVRHPGVDRISFTGSTAVGRRIMAAAAEGIKPLTLELGGKSAALLLDDADPALAAPAVLRMCLANAGQACVSQSRAIVPSALMPAFLDRLRAALQAWPLGDPLDPATRLGPVANAAQHTRVHRMLHTAVGEGALPLAGTGRDIAVPASGCYVAPTVFTAVKPGMEIAREEVFGPVLAVMGYEQEDEAVMLANATGYGLSGAVWSADASRAQGVARRMKTGQVIVNGAAQNLATPFGGWGLSGFGRENGRFGIEDLLNYRALHGA